MYSFYVFSLSPHSHVYLKLHSERAILPLQLYSFNGLFFFFKFELWPKKTNFKTRCRLPFIYTTVYQMLFV